MFHFFQILATVTLLSPSSAPNSRLDQWVTPNFSGGGSRVATTTRASSTRRGRPERGWSASAARPPPAYRSRHSCTVGRDTPTRPAISVLGAPSPANSTVRARCASPAFTPEDLLHDSRVDRSASRIRNGAAIRIRHSFKLPL